MNDKITVIIPFYNVEKYLGECLESVINQTYSNLEIICVNDCSPDNSIEIVEKYIQKDTRIQIIKHETNKGLGAARNTGIKNTTGKYIYFIDSDDFIDLNYIEELYNSIKSNRCDVACNNNILKYYEGASNKNNFIRNNIEISLRNKKIKITNEIIRKLQVSACCKLYNTEIIKKYSIYFTEGVKYEDYAFFYKYFSSINSITVINTSNYYYRQRENSIIHTLAKKKNDSTDTITIFEDIFFFYKENNLLDTFAIPFKGLRNQIRKKKKPKEFYYKIQDFLKIIQNEIIIKNKIYNKKERNFFNLCLNNSYFVYKIKHLLKIKR